MKLRSLLKHLHEIAPHDVADETITTLENDHRQVTAGSLFFCIKGYTVDGHMYAAAAVENGAVAVIAERPLDLPVPVIVVSQTSRALAVLADAFYHHPSKKMQMIGITGTNGKTTTTHLVDKIWQDARKKTGLIGTMYTKIGTKINETKNTTPESLSLQKTLADMVAADVDTTIMEVSSHALDLGRVHGVDFKVALFTNLTQDHLDYHGTMESYAAAKSLLFAQLGNTFDVDVPKYAIFNEDDEQSDVYKRATAAHILTYGIKKQADVMAKNIDITASGTTFDLVTPLGKERVKLQLVGLFNVYNALAALSVALVAGIEWKQAIASLESIEGVAGRFELVEAGQSFTVIVDYAHTPDSLKNVLETIQEFAEGRIFVVVGCGGNRDKTKRPLMADIACTYGTDAVFTSDNPRDEDPLLILKDMEKGVPGKKFVSIVDRKEAIVYAVENAGAGDVILIAGKGHETDQIIGDHTYEFNDRLVAIQAINEGSHQ